MVDQCDAPNNHAKIRKRYFKAPEPAPPFEGIGDITDVIAVAVSAACGNELVKMELLERDYDAIEYGISEEIKAKARETILIGKHMDSIQPPPQASIESPDIGSPRDSESFQGFSSPLPLATQAEDCARLSSQEVACLPPPKRYKEDDIDRLEVETSECIDLTSDVDCEAATSSS